MSQKTRPSSRKRTLPNTSTPSSSSPTPSRMSASSLSSQERIDSEMYFDSIKQAAYEAEQYMSPNEKWRFKKYCEGLERAMEDKADLSGGKIIAAVDLLFKRLGPYKESKPRIKLFFKKLENLKRMMVDGGRVQLAPSDDSARSLPRIETAVAAKTKPGSRSPRYRKQQLENSDDQTPTSTNDKTEKNRFDEMKTANKNLADLVKKLKLIHTDLIGNIQGVLLDNADSPVALVSDLRHLSESFAAHIEHNQCKAATMGKFKVSLGNKLSVVVNQWLSALKTDIEKGKWTASFDGDTPDELITTRNLLLDITKCLTKNSEREHTIRNEHKKLTSQLQDSEKRILKIWKLLSNGSDTSPEPSASDALNKLETFVTETKQSADKQTKEAKSLEEELEKLEEKIADSSSMKIKQNDKIVSPSQRIKDITQAITKWRNEDKSDKNSESKAKHLSSNITKVWLQINSGNAKTKDNGGDSIAMLEEIENWLKENKALIDRFQSIEESAHQEIKLLKKDIETLHDDKRSPVIHETKTDPALVRSLKQLRKDLLLKKYSSQKNVSESQRMYDMGCDEFRSNVTDVCAFCATDGKLNPALYFCKDCSKFGRYICGICNKNHGRFTNNHNVERIFTV